MIRVGSLNEVPNHLKKLQKGVIGERAHAEIAQNEQNCLVRSLVPPEC